MALSILVVRALVEGVERGGASRESFLGAAGYNAAWPEEGDTRLSVEEYDRLVELAIELSGDPALGLHMAEAADATTYSLVAHLIAYAKTMRQAVQSYLRYHRLLTDRTPALPTSAFQRASVRCCRPGLAFWRNFIS